MRIALVAQQLSVGGAEMQLAILARGLRSRGARPVVYSLGSEEEYWVDLLRETEVEVEIVPPGSVVERIRALRRAFARTSFDVVHAFHFNAAGYAVLASKRGRGIIAGIRSLPDRLNISPTLWQRFCLHAPRMLVVNSQAGKRLLHERFRWLVPEARVIHNGMNVLAADAIAVRRASARSALGLRPQQCCLALVARLESIKQPLVFLDSVEPVLRRHEDAIAVIIGDGAMRDDIDTAVSTRRLSGRVRLLGAMTNAPALLSGADVVCITSLSEGLPNVALEASAAGIPTAAMAVGGVPEVVRDGETGILVAPGDTAALSAQLGRLVADAQLRLRLGSSARVHVERAFGAERMIDAYVALYGESHGWR
jgi:glycosyltransferase involved in cell wall biosynthesis